MTMRPSNPSLRSVVAAAPAVRFPPTIRKSFPRDPSTGRGYRRGRGRPVAPDRGLGHPAEQREQLRLLVGARRRFHPRPEQAGRLELFLLRLELGMEQVDDLGVDDIIVTDG